MFRISLNGAVKSSFLFVEVLPIKYPKQLSDVFPAKYTNDISDRVLVVQRVGIDACYLP